MDSYPIWSQVAGGDAGSVVNALSPVNLGVVDHRGQLIPLVVLELPDAISHCVDSSTEFSVIFDLVNVHPFKVPLFGVLVVAFGGYREPICMIRPIPATGLRLEHQHPEMDAVWNGIHSMDRCLPQCFGNESGDCGLVVVNGHGAQVLSRLVKITTPYVALEEDDERFKEIEAAIEFLDARAIERSFSAFYAASQALVNSYCLPVRNPSGDVEVCPPGRSLSRSRSEIFSLLLADGRLVRREVALLERHGKDEDPEYDVFISYAHSEHELASRVAAYLQSEWPDLRVFITDPENQQEFENDPNFFIRASRRSRAIVFLASPNSIERPMTQTEVGLNANKQLYCLHFGWTGVDELEAVLADNIYVSIPTERIYELGSHAMFCEFLRQLASDLGVRVPDRSGIRELDAFDFRKHPVNYDLGRKYYEDFQKMERALSEKQTIEEANEELDRLISATTAGTREEKEYILRQGPHHKLCYVLDLVRNKGLFSAILGAFPALVDERLVEMLNGFYESDRIQGGWIPPVVKEVRMLIGRKHGH